MIKNGKIINWRLFPELIAEGLRYFGKDSNLQPIAIIEHPNQFTHFELNRIFDFLFTRFGTPSIGIIPSPLCSLINVGETSGIVVFIRPAIHAVVPVWGGNILYQYQKIFEKEPDAQTIVTHIQQIQKNCNEKMKDMINRIVFSGNPKKHGALFLEVKNLLKGSCHVIIPKDKFDIIRGGILITETRKYKEGCINRLQYECDQNNQLSVIKKMKFAMIPPCKLTPKMISILGVTPKTIHFE